MTLHSGLISAVLVLLAQGPDMSPAAREYLTKALDLIQANALTRERVDWPTVRARAFDQASHAQSPVDTYDAIRSVITALGDHHSSFQTPESMDALNRRAAPMAPAPSGSVLDGRLAHVVVPGCCSDRDAAARYATRLQAVLRSLDVPTTCGWIVDLRKNIGGNMWPMLAGLGPLFSGGAFGSFIGPNGDSATWSYDNGVVRLGRNEVTRVSSPPYDLRLASPFIAVLLGSATSSSGEAVAIAFRGNPNTRSFGQRTRGLTTANGTFTLSDGAMIILTQAIDADRHGRVFEDGVSPDALTDPSDDGVPIQARRWLLDQVPCRQ
jgi:C-terminal processing protease CtpA/Prc